MNKIIKNAVILTVITLVSGLALGAVYEITKEPIQKAQEKAKQTAYKKVLPDGKTFETDADFKESDAEKILKSLWGSLRSPGLLTTKNKLPNICANGQKTTIYAML